MANDRDYVESSGQHKVFLRIDSNPECTALPCSIRTAAPREGLSSDHGSDGAFVGIVGFGGESAGPGDVAMAVRVEGVAALAEGPLVAIKGLAQSEIVSGDVLLAAGEALLGGGKGHDLLALVVDGFFGLDPFDLVRQEVLGEDAPGVEFE